MASALNKQGGFTLIEILVSIVVISILVGIVTVSFSGITNQSRQSALENTLFDTAAKARTYKTQNGAYPTSLSDIETTNNEDIELAFINLGYNSFCIYAYSNNGPTYHLLSDTTKIVEGSCQISPLQSYTKSTCPSTRTLSVDARDNRTYWIQKLADDNCWMLTNLAYAGGTANGGSNQYNDVIDQGGGNPANPKGTLSNGTSDSTATYTEAKYYIPPGANPTTAPTIPSTSTSGTGQYGYLYNWCAAMGSQNTSACAENTIPSPVPTINICPAGWRLPESSNDGLGELVAMNNYVYGGKIGSDSSIIGEPLLLQRSGLWQAGFYYQGTNGNVWSSTPTTNHEIGKAAGNIAYHNTLVNPINYQNKTRGLAVRCIAE